jgi:hypothetical protein
MTHGVHRGFLLEFKWAGEELSDDDVQKSETESFYHIAVAVFDSPQSLVDWLADTSALPNAQRKGTPPSTSDAPLTLNSCPRRMVITRAVTHWRSRGISSGNPQGDSTPW